MLIVVEKCKLIEPKYYKYLPISAALKTLKHFQKHIASGQHSSLY